MVLATERFWWLGGWPGAALLTGLYLFVEIVAIAWGGNSGSLVFVSWHFVLAPLVAGFQGVFTIVAAARQGSTKRRVVTISSLAVNLLITYVAWRGEPGLLRFFDVD